MLDPGEPLDPSRATVKGTIVRELARIAAATAVTACIATAPAVAQAQNEDVTGEITLMSYAGIFEDQYKQAVIEPFLEAYPNVSVNYFTTGNSAQMLGALRAQQSDPRSTSRFSMPASAWSATPKGC